MSEISARGSTRRVEAKAKRVLPRSAQGPLDSGPPIIKSLTRTPRSKRIAQCKVHGHAVLLRVDRPTAQVIESAETMESVLHSRCSLSLSQLPSELAQVAQRRFWDERRRVPHSTPVAETRAVPLPEVSLGMKVEKYAQILEQER